MVLTSGVHPGCTRVQGSWVAQILRIDPSFRRSRRQGSTHGVPGSNEVGMPESKHWVTPQFKGCDFVNVTALFTSMEHWAKMFFVGFWQEGLLAEIKARMSIGCWFLLCLHHKAMYRSARIFVQTGISILDIVYNPLWYQIKDNYNTICFAYAKT